MEDYKNLGEAASRYRSFLRRDGNTIVEGEENPVLEGDENKNQLATEEPGGTQNNDKTQEGQIPENAFTATTGLNEDALKEMDGVEEGRASGEIDPRNDNDHAVTQEVEKLGKKKRKKKKSKKKMRERNDDDGEKGDWLR